VCQIKPLSDEQRIKKTKRERGREVAIIGVEFPTTGKRVGLFFYSCFLSWAPISMDHGEATRGGPELSQTKDPQLILGKDRKDGGRKISGGHHYCILNFIIYFIISSTWAGTWYCMGYNRTHTYGNGSVRAFLSIFHYSSPSPSPSS
jgi:hypothetical protein